MELKIFSGQASRELTKKICDCLGMKPGAREFVRFSDGEFKVRFGESVRGCDIFIVQSTYPPSDNLWELRLWINAAKKASVKSGGFIHAVIPYFGWGRQDRKSESRVSVAAEEAAHMIEEAGADHVLTVDLHAAQIAEFFTIPVDHLYARPVFVEHFKRLFNLENFVVMGPDSGAAKVAESYAQRLDGRPLVFAYKMRSGTNQAKILHIVGEVEGKDVLIVDDMTDTCGTLMEAVRVLRERGASKIYAFCTHGVLSGPAISRIEQSELARLYVTDSVPPKKYSPKIEVVSIAPLLAEAIKRSHNNQSISSLFE